MHSTVGVPHHGAAFWKQWRAYVGPALLISIGYMDPGNWGTDLSGGASFKYDLLWVVALASLMAIFLQVVSARLGVVTGKHLAQCCRDWYPQWTRWPNWLLCELAIGACDMAEVLGSAVAINLLTHNHIPIFWAVIITGGDVLLLLALQRFGMRKIEAIVLVLISTIALCYFIEIFVIPQTKPSFLEMGHSLFHPGFRHAGMVYVAIGIIGATVMPHNLYLHSALVQSRKLQKDEGGIRAAIRFNTIDSVMALSLAFLVNAAILVLAAMVFYNKSSVTVAGGQVVPFNENTDWIRAAYLTLGAAAGCRGGQPAVCHRTAGQRSGQHHHRYTGGSGGDGRGSCTGGSHHGSAESSRGCWRLFPRYLFIGIRGDASVTDLLNLSQVVLALQLPLAMFPLLHFTSSRKRMGQWKSGWFLLIAAWGSAILITVLDIYGLPDAIRQAWQVVAGG